MRQTMTFYVMPQLSNADLIGSWELIIATGNLSGLDKSRWAILRFDATLRQEIDLDVLNRLQK